LEKLAMFKRIVLCLLISCLPCFCFASLSDAASASDGLLETGEYDGSAFEMEAYDKLIVNGGGAYKISARDNSYLEVKGTSTPVSNNTGIRYIVLYDDSEMLYLNGTTLTLTVRDDSTAILKGGSIGSITIYHLSSWSNEVIIYCQEDYVMDSTGISGLWMDGTSFSINFNDVGGAFASYPTADYVTVITPEPMTLTLLGFGGLLIRRKK
jgi:hypothetical protein